MYLGATWHWNTEYDHLAFPLEVEDEGYKIADEDLILMQYTGLKDKNGKEIYEGDIVESEKNMMFNQGKQTDQVRFEDGAFKVATVNLSTITTSFYPEVIGNIYENPELLERG